MSLFYRVAYAVGFTPWDEESVELSAQRDTLFAREEAAREPSYGFVLDLGCGKGPWSIELARRGWRVVGVDLVPKALRTARQRAEAAGVDVDFREGDVTALRDAGVGTGFQFLLDVECFNHLNGAQRMAMGREVNAVAAPDATMLLLVWTRARRGPLPPGASRADLEAAFPGWRVVAEDRYTAELTAPLKRVDPHWYRMART